MEVLNLTAPVTLNSHFIGKNVYKGNVYSVPKFKCDTKGKRHEGFSVLFKQKVIYIPRNQHLMPNANWEFINFFMFFQRKKMVL